MLIEILEDIISENQVYMTMIREKVYNLFLSGVVNSSAVSMLLIGLFNAILILWSLRGGILEIGLTGLLIRTAMATATMTTAIIFASPNNLFMHVIIGMMICFVIFVAISGVSKIDLVPRQQ